MPSWPRTAASVPVDQTSAEAPRTVGGRALSWIKLIVSLGLYAVIFYTTDVRLIARHLAGAHVGFVAAAVLLYATGQAISTFKWQILLRPLG
ncbi:MAG TPA: hypothetical protein VNK41_00760, partial [Vicinamibacterales bacterium]|nr:hypothetical protein [Vicinamibacterales bacterium]